MRYSLAHEHRTSGFVRTARHYLVIVFGYILLAIGIVMVVAPGPALIVIPVALALLGTELVWARRWLRYVKKEIKEVKRKAVRSIR